MTESSSKYTLSVIIVTYQSEDTIEMCLKSIYNTNFSDFEVIIVDSQTNSDRTLEIIQKLNFPRLKIIPQLKNVGYALGNNIGTLYAEGNLLLIMNPDVAVPPNFIKNFLDEFLRISQNYKNKLIYSPIIKISNGVKHFYKGAINSLGFSFIPKYKPTLNPRNPDSIKTDFVSGCCFIISRADFKKLKKFDPSYFIYYEDVFLSLKAHSQNFILRVSRNLVITHYQKSDYRLGNLKYFYVERNRLRTIFRLTSKPIRTLLATILFEPVMLIQSIIFNTLPLRFRIYRDILYFHRRDRKNTEITEKIDFGHFTPNMEGITSYLEFKNKKLREIIDFFINLYAKILHLIIK